MVIHEAANIPMEDSTVYTCMFQSHGLLGFFFSYPCTQFKLLHAQNVLGEAVPHSILSLSPRPLARQKVSKQLLQDILADLE
jgi:hypothetical protein